MRRPWWILAFLALPGVVLAQQTQQKPAEKPAVEEQKAPEQAAPAAKPRSLYPPAPKPGHPLDPADVDVLTGRTKSSNPYGRYGYPLLVDPYAYAGGSRFGGTYFNPSGGDARPALPPVAFGRVNGRRFFLLGPNSNAGLPLVYFRSGADRVLLLLGPGFPFF